jgi:tetratricopeptide (TPR) repeat protein
LARVWLALSYVSLLRAQCAAMEDRVKRALHHGRRAPDRRIEALATQWLCNLLYFGPTPIEEAVPRLQGFRRKHAGSLAMEHRILGILGAFEVMSGRPEKAMELIEQAEALATDAGDRVSVGYIRGFMSGGSHLFCGDAERAERELRQSYDIFDRAGGQGYQSSIAGLLADALYLQGSYSEAEHFATICADLAAPGDVLAQQEWRTVRAKLLAQRGELKEADRLIREAVALADTTDFLDYQGWTYLGLADVLQRGGRTNEARAAIEIAITRYAAKGYLVAAQRARQLPTQLPAETQN